MTYKTGTIGEFMQWTKKVVTKGEKKAGPKRWFDSDATAAKAVGKTSPEAMVKLLSHENLTRNYGDGALNSPNFLVTR